MRYVMGTPGRVYNIEPGIFTTISFCVVNGVITQGEWPEDRPTLRAILGALIGVQIQK